MHENHEKQKKLKGELVCFTSCPLIELRFKPFEFAISKFGGGASSVTFGEQWNLLEFLSHSIWLALFSWGYLATAKLTEIDS